jgi:hypothetical protein
MMVGDMESSDEILRHRGDWTRNLLVVLRVRALSEHRSSHVRISAKGPGIPKATTRSGKPRDAAKPSFVWFGSGAMVKINLQLMDNDGRKNGI